MFLGHFGVALAAKQVAPRASLGTLVLAAQFLDLLWPVLVLLGIERVRIEPGNTVVTPLNFVHYPYSHSLLAAVVWAALLATLYNYFRKDSRGATWIGLLVFSHWLLDFISHRPDLPLYPGSRVFVGLGLWNSFGWTLDVEGLILLWGVVLYLRATRAKDRTGTWAFWAFLVFLVVIYLASLFGPPPPSVKLVAISGLLMWLLVAWAWWIDRHRELHGAGVVSHS